MILIEKSLYKVCDEVMVLIFEVKRLKTSPQKSSPQKNPKDKVFKEIREWNYRYEAYKNKDLGKKIY